MYSNRSITYEKYNVERLFLTAQCFQHVVKIIFPNLQNRKCYLKHLPFQRLLNGSNIINFCLEKCNAPNEKMHRISRYLLFPQKMIYFLNIYDNRV